MSYDNQALSEVISHYAPFLHPSKKAFLSPSVSPRREYTWTLNSKKSLFIYFGNCQDVPYSHEQEQDDEHPEYLKEDLANLF